MDIKMRWYFLVCLLAVPLLARADNSLLTRLINPASSELQVSSTTDEPVAEIHFSGLVWVSGTLDVEWIKDVRGADMLVANIVPVKGQLKALPHIRDDEFQIIGIDDAEQAVKIAFEKDFGVRVLNKQVRSAVMQGRFLLKDYVIGECGSPWASADIAAAKDQQKPVLKRGAQGGDC